MASCWKSIPIWNQWPLLSKCPMSSALFHTTSPHDNDSLKLVTSKLILIPKYLASLSKEVRIRRTEMEGKSEVKGAVVGESQKRAREETTVTEEEVEEFLAILKRINVAVRYFKKGNGDIRNLTDLRMVEDSLNVEVNDGENVGLDLNADPDTGSDPF
ncbi:hypothetical protein J1N35_026764 [Gossypium stocksii]|uniref:Uncharacterized protein n=1 Tax=Gossypium stocksii TaxID=47602 RepID=A0A9D3VAB7_9ROSI|nr:hypothetical protein J1N35_026764 [Gossypium stocksii]